VIFTRVPLSQMFTNSVTLAITRPSVPDGPVAGPMSRSLSFPIHSLRPSLVTINYKKRTPPLAPPHHPHAFLSTTPPAGLPLYCCRLAAQGRNHLAVVSPPPRTPLARALRAPYRRGAVQPLTGGRTAARPLPSSFSSATT
jgi:hypothetical protein